MFFLSFIYGIYLYVKIDGLMLEWLIYSVNSINIEIFLFLDWISLIFVRVVILISSIVMFYRVYYIHRDRHISRFYILVFIFIVSIILMIVRPNLVRILLGWDGLGLVSYCLVIYYQNQSSYNSGIITVLSNRLGDVGLLISIGLLFYCGSWNTYLLNEGDLLIIFLIFFASITKRAQVPFSYWLPQAMAAPTPVSSLVHSSTLVTAGVYLIIRFNFYICGSKINYVLIILSMLTRLIAGIMANFEYDLKKIIALSTLRQLGLMIVILCIGLVNLAFYHLIVHALFKSLLFLCSGIIIHQILNNQDIRFYGGLNEFIPMVIIRFYIARLALCGAPFLAGFYSKDLLVEVFNLSEVNLLMSIMIILSLVITVRYTFRLFYYVFFSEVIFYYRWSIFTNEWLMNFSICILVICRILAGSIFNWLFFFDVYEPYISLLVKLITAISFILGVFCGFVFCLLSFIKFYLFVYFIRLMWITILFYSYIYKPLIVNCCLINEFDKTWVEYNTKYLFIYLFEKFNMLFLNSHKIYIFRCLILFFFLVIFII